MGIQILNKDVSIISNVMGNPKANIGSIFGTTGWAGGGDVTPNPTPNWANISGLFSGEDGWLGGTYSTQQITGISTSIVLNVVSTNPGSQNGYLYYKINTTSTLPDGSQYPPSIGYTAANYGTNTFITINNNEWLSFGYSYSSSGNPLDTFNVYNTSDSNTLLDTFIAYNN